jgi:hypothetical protein
MFVPPAGAAHLTKQALRYGIRCFVNALARSFYADEGRGVYEWNYVYGDQTLMSAIDAVDGSSTGIAMCHIAVVIQKQRMSAYGTKQTFQPMGIYVRFRG